MCIDEINALYKAKDIDDRRAWEQARTISFWSVVAQHGNKVFKSPGDLFSFSWENNKPSKAKGKKLTKEEAEAKVSLQ